MAIDIQALLGEENLNAEEVLDKVARVYRLTDKQKLFVKYYTENGNHRGPALLKAGYQSENRELIEDKSNKGSAATRARATLSLTGTTLLKNKKIQNALKEYAVAFARQKKGSIEGDVYRVAQLRATYDIRQMADCVVGNSPEEIAEKLKALPEETAMCIDGFTFKYHGAQAQQFTVDFKFADRDKSIQLLSKLAGLLVDKKEVKHDGTSMPAINIAVLGGEAKRVN